jgi:hypothetical protein
MGVVVARSIERLVRVRWERFLKLFFLNFAFDHQYFAPWSCRYLLGLLVTEFENFLADFTETACHRLFGI